MKTGREGGREGGRAGVRDGGKAGERREGGSGDSTRWDAIVRCWSSYQAKGMTSFA